MSGKHLYWPDLTDDEGDALEEWIEDTCGDCIEGRCHWGGERSRQSIQAVKRGEEYVDPQYGRCRCASHVSSVLARPFWRDYDTPQATAVAWREAKARGEIVIVEEDA
jgi:hypothetical protein